MRRANPLIPRVTSRPRGDAVPAGINCRGWPLWVAAVRAGPCEATLAPTRRSSTLTRECFCSLHASCIDRPKPSVRHRTDVSEAHVSVRLMSKNEVGDLRARAGHGRTRVRGICSTNRALSGGSGAHAEDIAVEVRQYRIAKVGERVRRPSGRRVSSDRSDVNIAHDARVTALEWPKRSDAFWSFIPVTYVLAIRIVRTSKSSRFPSSSSGSRTTSLA